MDLLLYQLGRGKDWIRAPRRERLVISARDNVRPDIDWVVLGLPRVLDGKVVRVLIYAIGRVNAAYPINLLSWGLKD